MIISYFAIGALIMFGMEAWIDPNKEKIEEINEEELKFDWITRLFNIVLWPITLAIILKHLFEYLKNILK